MATPTLPRSAPWAAALGLALPLALSAQPAGFTKTTVVAGIQKGTSLAHAPDGRIFVAEIAGTVKVVQNGAAKAVHAVSTNTDREQGLLKIGIHPRFAQNGWLYLYYLTSDKHHHNIDRIAVDKDNKVTENRNLVQLVPLTNQGRHNGSGMAFGKDGFLYVGRGEDEQDHWASQWATQRGKILRFTEDGKPAPGNPHSTAATAEEQSVWARGFRNPWSLTVDPASGRIFEGEVGASDEEINDVTRPDAASDYWYGWGGGGDGPNQNAGTIKPFFSYGTGSLGCAITGVAAFNPPGSTWPAEWKNRVYFTDWCSGFIRAVDIANPGAASTVFVSTGVSNALGLTVGIDGGLYWVGHNSGQLNRISNAPIPTALAQARKAATDAPVLLRANTSGRTTLDLAGVSGQGEARLILFSAEGRQEAVLSARVDGSQISVSRPETLRPGLRPFRFEWRNREGVSQVRRGRLLILP